MIKIRFVLLFSFDEEEIKCTPQQALESIKEAFAETISEEKFTANCKVVEAKLIEEEVEAF